MKENKIKKFWEKNKSMIVIGAVSAVAGGALSVVLNRKVYGEALTLMETVRSYDYVSANGNTFVGDVIEAQGNADYVEIFKYGDANGGALANLIADVKAGIDMGRFDPNANVVGCVVFTKKNET